MYPHTKAKRSGIYKLMIDVIRDSDIVVSGESQWSKSGGANQKPD